MQAKKEKKDKDPNAPTRPLSTYFRFLAANRPRIKAANPTMTTVDLARACALNWKHVDEDEKAGYQKDYDADKAAYTLAMSTYVAPAP